MESVLPILPLVATLGAALVALASRGRPRSLAITAAVAQLAVLVPSVILFVRCAGGEVLVHRLGGWPVPQGIVFVADRLSSGLLVLLSVIFCGAVAYFFLDHETSSRSRSLALISLLQTGVVGALLAGDLFDFYVFFELMGLASYGLVAYRGEEAHVEASLKYAALSLLGSTLMLMGVGAIYGQTGLLTLATLREASAAVASRPLYLFAVALVLTALALKTALIPLHFWLPDAHSIAPTAVSVLLSGAVVKIGAYGILRVLGVQDPWVWAGCRDVLVAAGALTAFVAALMATAQRDLKRLLAYSTASQMGYVIAAGALGTPAGVAAALVMIAAHAPTKGALFLCAGTAMDATGERRWDRMGGLLPRSPLFATAMLVPALSLAGIPPLAGFAGKLTVFGALLDEGRWVPLACLLGASTIVLWLAARIWIEIFGGQASPETRAPARSKVILATAAALLVAAVGIGTGPLLRAAGEAASDLLGGESYRRVILGKEAP